MRARPDRRGEKGWQQMAVATRQRGTGAPPNRQRPRPAPTRPTRPARPDVYAERVAAFRRGLVVGIGAGLSIALVIAAVAFLTGVGTGLGGAPQARAQAPAAPVAGQQAPQPPAGASVQVRARHVGALKVRIEAEVGAASARTRGGLQKAEVVAYTDMVEMPMSHRQGPIAMREVPGRPGIYQAESTVPMMGRYDVHVEVRSPLTGSAHETIDVATIPAPAP
jgi:hypothetical protein